MKLFGYDINVAKATKAAKAPTKAQGVVGLKASSGFIQEEFLNVLRWPQAGRVYQEMASNDAIIGGCLYLIETFIRSAKWSVEAASDDTGDVEAAEFLESCMFDMQQTWDDFVCEVLSMLVYGFSFHEIVYKIRRGPFERDPKYKSGYTDGKFGWQELPVRSHATLSEWTIDNKTGEVLEFVQDPGLAGIDTGIIKIPIAGNLLFKTKASRGNPEGWSILRRAYRSWYFKRYIEELEGIGIERNLAGIPIIQPPEDVDLFNKDDPNMVSMLNWSQQLVNDLRQDRNHGVVLPGGWSLKLLGVDGSGRTLDTDNIIRRHETRMAMSMLSDLVIMGGDRTGSFALAETKQNLFITSLQALVNSIAATLNNQAVPMLFAVNGWQLEKMPKIVVSDMNSPSIKEVALILRSFKVDITKNRELLNFMLKLIQAPTMSEQDFNNFLALQASEEGKETDDEYQDTVTNDAKQSDEFYTGGGE